jgi:IMP dehydrogenase
MAAVRKEEALSFDDVLLVPKRFDGGSRNNIDISTTIGNLKLEIPIISSNMPGVTGPEMASAMANAGGLGIIHRMDSLENQCKMIRTAKANSNKGAIGASIGSDDWERTANSLLSSGADIICIDVAHGHQSSIAKTAKEFRWKYSDVPLIVGNFATKQSLDEFWNFGDFIYKIGIGGGSVCSTRIQTGCGIPTLQTVLDCANDTDHECIADGGIKTSGDIVKSLAAGAKAVMLGSLLAGTDEAPGEPIKGKDGKLYKIYRGNASYGSKKNYFGKAEYIEGAETLVEYKGPVEKVLKNICQGIKSGLSYCGAMNIKELQTKAEFVKITSSGFKESVPHGLL